MFIYPFTAVLSGKLYPAKGDTTDKLPVSNSLQSSKSLVNTANDLVG